MHHGEFKGVRPFRTRQLLAEWAVDHLRARLAEGARVLFGIDAGLGYPRGFAEALGLGAPAWLETWRELDRLVHDGRDNANNRFEVAGSLNGRMAAPVFWGAPEGADPALTMRRPAVEPLPRFRLAEEHARRAGSHPKSVWQLGGAGAVGSQTLLAIPRALQLRAAMGGQLVVWPFETGFTAAFDAPLVLAEIYPSALVARRSGEGIPDAVQTEDAARALHAADIDGSLAGWLALPGLDPATAAVAVAEEGWILGTGRLER